MGDPDNRELDEPAKADVRAERQRYTAALASLRTDDADGFVAEFQRHRDAMRHIMLRLAARRGGTPPEHLNAPRE